MEPKIHLIFTLSSKGHEFTPLLSDWICTHFSGTATTCIAANLSGRRFLGIEKELDFVNISKSRRDELNNISQNANLTSHIPDLSCVSKESLIKEPYENYGTDLPF